MSPPQPKRKPSTQHHFGNLSYNNMTYMISKMVLGDWAGRTTEFQSRDDWNNLGWKEVSDEPDPSSQKLHK
jgi:hypothetical protein